jgi:hypothetical protein
LGFLILAPQEGYADGECTPLKTLKELHAEGVAAEESGNLPLAFEAYQFASYGSGCEGPNPASKDAEEGWKRTGRRLAQEAEAKGNLYAHGNYKEVKNAGGYTLVQWNGRGAFQWYERMNQLTFGGEAAAMDRVMFKYIQSKPKDLDAFQTAVHHFFQGNSGDHNAAALQDLGKKAASNPGDKTLQERFRQMKELEKIAFKNIDEQLAQEDAAFHQKPKTGPLVPLSERNRPFTESMGHLATTRDWYNQINDPKMNKAAERARKRGEESSKVETPLSVANARSYFAFAEDDRVQRVMEQANRLGDAHAKKGDYKTAEEFYVISENEAKIAEMQSRLEEEYQKKQKGMEKAVQEMIKDDKQQKNFKKEQEDLEKELGF